MRAGVVFGLLAAAAAPGGLATAQSPGLPQAPIVIYLPPTVRSAALNGAATALVGDAGAVFANPAGLATIGHIALEGAYRTLPGPKAFVATGAFGWRIRQFDLGVGARYADFGTQPGAFVVGATSGQATRDVLGVGSLVYRRGLFAIGFSGKRLERRVGGTVERGTSGDAGLAIAFFDIMAFAFSVQNISGNWQGASNLAMPRLSRLGFTMNYVDPQESFRLLSVLELQWPQGESARFVAGGEAGVVLEGVGVVGRLAYGSRSVVGGGGADVTYGASLAIGRMDLDWAYRSDDLLGRSAHQFGLRLRL